MIIKFLMNKGITYSYPYKDVLHELTVLYSSLDSSLNWPLLFLFVGLLLGSIPQLPCSLSSNWGSELEVRVSEYRQYCTMLLFTESMVATLKLYQEQKPS